MFCLYCGSSQVMVANSRPTVGNTQIWRRRKCIECGGIFTTYERADMSHLTVTKKSGKRERFKRSKLYSGIYHSSIDKKNADRGEMSELTEKIVRQVEQKILSFERKKINSVEIRDLILKVLVKKAPDVFLRFLAYREGHNKKEMKELLKKYF